MDKKKLLRARNYYDSAAPAGPCDQPRVRTLSSSGNLSGATRMVKRGGDGWSAPSPSSPLTVEELQEGRLTDAVIRAAAGTRRLEVVTKLALVIDSSKTCVDGKWTSMPRLRTLTLNGSRLVSFRDLGVGLRNLNTLSLESSGVKDLDGIAALSGLRELRLAHNRVSDVTPLACHGNLQALDLEWNRICEVNALDILGTLPILYSLDLRWNPLTDSLSNLRNGNGRGVVHKLIPQIRILDGVHLTNTSDAIDIETLEEAVGLIHQGASRARAAWSEEDATVEKAITTSDAAGNRRQVKRKDEGSTAAKEGSTDLLVERRRSKPEVVGVGGSLTTSPVVAADRDIVDWDSDLTQGGTQSFSGKPSSAIRRHKLARDIKRHSMRESPAQVLETLDLAKMMEQGFKQRQGSDRLADWRREILLDSLPYEDPTMVLLEGPASQELGTRPLVGEIRNRRSISPRPYSRVCPDAGNSAQKAYKEDAGKSARRSGIARKLAFFSKGVTGDAAEEELRVLLCRNERGVSGRPWTTDQQFERSATRLAVTSGRRHVSTSSASISERGLQTRGQGTPGIEAVEPRQGRPHPQTAPLLARQCNHEEEESQKTSTTWQPVWQSLQTSQLVSSTRLGSLAKGSPPEQSKPADRFKHIDFRRQRRARKAKRRGSERTRGTGTGRGGGSGNMARDSDSTSGHEADSGDDSGGSADVRDAIKRRVADLLINSGEELSSRVGASNTWGIVSTPRTPKILRDKRSGEQRVVVARRQQQASAESQSAKARHETKSESVASRRSLAAMDDSSSESSNGYGRNEHRSSHFTAEGRRNTDSSIACGRGDGGGGNPKDPLSSICASLRLGFDLKKSLAAIDDWTEQVTTPRDGCGSPQQTTTETGQSIMFFVQPPRDAAASSCASEKLNDKHSCRKQRKNVHRAIPCPGRSANNSAVNLAVVTDRAKIAAAVDSERMGSDEDGSDGEAVLSVAAARAALGISKAMSTTSAAIAIESDVIRRSGVTTVTMPPPIVPENRAQRPSPAEIDALAGNVCIRITETSSGRCENTANNSAGSKSLASTTSSGLALGMSDEVLEGMLRRHPRTVPEIRTKGSFREFFRGMEAERMTRLLRGAYEGTLPAGEVDRKVKRRLGLIDDLLAW